MRAWGGLVRPRTQGSADQHQGWLPLGGHRGRRSPPLGLPAHTLGDGLEAVHSPRLLELATVLFGFSPGIIRGVP